MGGGGGARRQGKQWRGAEFRLDAIQKRGEEEVEENFLFHFVSGIRAHTIDATVLSVGGGERGGLEKK